jgi:hypothetical protein
MVIVCTFLHTSTLLNNIMYIIKSTYIHTYIHTYIQHSTYTAPTRHFVVLSKVWFFIIKYIVFEAYPLLAPKCRVGAGAIIFLVHT